MEGKILARIAEETGIDIRQIKNTVKLLDDDNTVPFIARYRKEVTGGLDETGIRRIQELLRLYRNLEERKAEVIRLIAEQGKLTLDIEKSIVNARNVTAVEDIYRPFRPKRKTRASAAREKGLEGLALFIRYEKGDPEKEAEKYLSEKVVTIKDALKGAVDIIAEEIADDADIRGYVRNYLRKTGIMVCRAEDEEKDSVYRMYYNYSEPVDKIPPHRILAINRGEREGYIKVDVEVDVDKMLNHIRQSYRAVCLANDAYMQKAAEDAYKRLIEPSVIRDIRNELTKKAEEHAVEIFAQNLRHLLLQPPIKDKMVLGVDPAYRTGCKWAVVDETGRLLETGVVYPTLPQQKVAEAKQEFIRLVRQYKIDIIAIGNGTASRETEQFVAEFIQENKEYNLAYIIVNEAGASVYSASELAKEEFPGLDVAERSAVSIARRLQDPLAELVKIEPRSIGVGQYQHDVNPKFLAEKLTWVVESAVNYVGVDVNTASASLLSYVAGINSTVANNIVKYREENGKFKNRKELLKVPRLGAKAFEQCAGFLRIEGGDNPLDGTAIHPESYEAALKLLDYLGMGLNDLGSEELKEKIRKLDLAETAGRLEIGVPTLEDMIENMIKPKRDPREELPLPIFRQDVLSLEDLKPGMRLKGTVTNVVDFGAFIDIGVKNSGLVHISELSHHFVRHPMEVVTVGDVVEVEVLSVDAEKGRIALSMRI
ncbi:Tex family protein [Thermosyntropha sp.]|uniref:Tex family protein n=1 Tax=Thermosyntropha sp. TaxID=2740820 RepID=UPI0025E6CA86|nr:Tex family protein [Thermosyntropha sp.]MBO8158209.1 RNA-binding transcriptional accessory protein [Thermosyntropha sp.]